jgi:hypothetical protein
MNTKQLQIVTDFRKVPQGRNFINRRSRPTDTKALQFVTDEQKERLAELGFVRYPKSPKSPFLDKLLTILEKENEQ